MNNTEHWFYAYGNEKLQKQQQQQQQQKKKNYGFVGKRRSN